MPALPAALLAAIPSPPVTGIPLGPLDLRAYGVLIAVGAYLGLTWTVRRYEAAGGDPALAERAGLMALLGGFLGARLGYVLPRLDRYVDRPEDILAIWQGGLALFGGLLGGTIAAVLVVRRRGGDLAAFTDAIAPALPLAQAIGRWGNWFNQELYGRPTDLPWALEIAPEARRPGFESAETFHPTFLYESLWNVALVLVLLRVERRRAVPRGALILVYVVGYGLGRTLIETLRIDTAERYAGLSRNNWIALVVTVAGLVALQRLRRRDPEVADVADVPDVPDATAEGTGPAAEPEDADGPQA